MRKMSRYKALPITTKYWKPGENYLNEIVRNVAGRIADGDFVAISEKAISTSLGNIVDESRCKPSQSAVLIAKIWMRVCWGYFLGPLCHFHRKLLQRLRRYPVKLGSRHKQVALTHSGLLQALMFGSEGGIDGSNLPYSLVSLPLDKAAEKAEKIRRQIWLALRKKIGVIIVDTDKTYSFGNFHFTPRPKPTDGIHSFGGFVTFVVGRMLCLEKSATPIAVAGGRITIEEALEMAKVANRSRGYGAGRTVWDMANRFEVGLNAVSWKMLETIKHKPIVILTKQMVDG
jgi:F420-0:gamma-glutamyl ligase-like protein